MRKIIKGKVYDTATADLILTLYSGARMNRRDYYMTKKGAFFCHYVRINDLDVVPEKTMKDFLIQILLYYIF